MIFCDTMETPLGRLTIEADATNLLRVLYDHEKIARSPNDITEACKKQLQQYFNGDLKVFDLPFKFQGTAFQVSVWQALLDISYGETSTYGRQANVIGNPKAMRAVGAANGQNKINIIVPCHRIIGANGSLTGYGGGMERKRWLLAHEKELSGDVLL